jgi:hypothetical protein
MEISFFAVVVALKCNIFVFLVHDYVNSFVWLEAKYAVEQLHPEPLRVFVEVYDFCNI